MNSPTVHPGWTLTLPVLVLSTLMSCLPERRLWAAIPAALVYLVMQWLFPKCRLRRDHYFCPVNIALVLLLLKIVVVPMLIMLTGPESAVLSSLPSYASMETALLIDTLSYLAFCVGLALAPTGPIQLKPSFLTDALSNTPGVKMNLLFVGLGLIGFASAFGTLPRLVFYFTNPEEMNAIQAELDGTWTGLIGTLLRPFMAFAAVAWWCRTLDSSVARNSWRPAVYGLLAAVGVTFANLTFSFNRAAFVFPLLCMVAVYNARVRRIPLGMTVTAAAIFLPILILVGTYRSTIENGHKKEEATFATALNATSENLQAYTTGPQYTALFYDYTGWGEHPYGGSTLLASVMSPVPILGKSFRTNSGPAIFNFAIYRISGIEDQIIPFATELFANFHAPGLICGMIGLGLLLCQTERWFAAAHSTFAAFAIQYVSLWGALLTVWSAAIYSQILIYFFIPVYVYPALLLARNWLRKFQPPVPHAFGVTR